MGAVAGRYARAFAEVVAEHKLDAATVVEELGEIAALVNGHAELRNVLENPAVEQKQKLGLLDAIIKRLRAGKLLRNFVAALIDHKRIGQVSSMLRCSNLALEYQLACARLHLGHVEVDGSLNYIGKLRVQIVPAVRRAGAHRD